MNAGQYEGLMGVLTEIRDRMPSAPATEVRELRPPVRPGTQPLTDHDHRAAASLALYTLLVNLDGWVEGAHENHEALGHRGENIGSECWRSFDPSDIRRMVNDVARELGLSEYPIPTTPREDTYR